MADASELIRSDQLEGACDCAIHIYDARRAIAATASFVPPDAPLAAYPLPKRMPAFRNVVLSQPTAYGFDNSLLLEGLAARGNSARGVAVIGSRTAEEEIGALHAAGIRGVRFMLQGGGAIPASDLAPLAERIAPFGWHVKIQADGEALLDLIAAVPGRILIDVHPATVSTDAARKAVKRVYRRPEVYIALSAPHAGQARLAPEFDSVARELVRDDPTRIVWASNWPHVNAVPPTDPLKPVAWLGMIAAEALPEILVAAPARLYDLQTA